MAMNLSALRALTVRYRVQSEALGISVLAILISVWLGTSARRQAAPLVTEHDRLRAAQREISDFRASFRPASPGEEAAARIPDSLAMTVSHDARIALAQRIAQQAERSGLGNVRVRFAAADTASQPRAPQLVDGSAQVAAYSMVVEGDGGFATALSLVRQLPPAVALQRMTADRTKSGVVHYTLVLAVFESAGRNQHG